MLGGVQSGKHYKSTGQKSQAFPSNGTQGNVSYQREKSNIGKSKTSKFLICPTNASPIVKAPTVGSNIPGIGPQNIVVSPKSMHTFVYAPSHLWSDTPRGVHLSAV